MTVFSDKHHSDLAYSLQLLFENRMGYNLYFPIGMEWYKKGYWNIYPHIDTAKQYLDLRDIYIPKDGTPVLNEHHKYPDGTHYVIEDKHNQTWHLAITFDQFMEMDIDIVIASIPQHIKPFKELAKIKGAKFIFQQGNMFSEVLNNLHEIPNLLSSTISFPVPSTCNAIFYHQEFNTNIFKPLPQVTKRSITSFINVYHKNGGFVDYVTLRAMMLDWDFKSYGAQNDDGVCNTTQEMANKMNETTIGFHSKYIGDGFGHILYNWYASGKPVITRISDYKGKLGEELLTDGETCFDLDACNYQQLYDRISNMTDNQYDYMCQQSYQRFIDKVNYDSEEVKIREFLERLN